MNKETRYGKIYIDLLQAIQSGKLKAGDKLPTEQELCAKYKVSRITGKKALELLAQQGMIYRIPGKGSFVSSEPPSAEPAAGTAPAGNVIGVVMSDFASDFGTEFIRGVQSACAQRNGIVAISCMYTTQEEETREISRLISNGVRGLIIMPVHGASYNPAILTSVLNDFPLVLADRYLSGLSVPYVGTKNAASSSHAVKYLFSMGHRRIAFISSMPTTTALKERLDGYVDAYAQSDNALDKQLIKTDIRYTMPGMNTAEILRSDINNLKAFLTAHPEVTAVLAADYHIALVVQQAVNELGRKIPDDISLICYDRVDGGRYAYTFIRQKQFEIGANAGRLLLERIAGDKTPPKRILLDSELIPGDSVKRLQP